MTRVLGRETGNPIMTFEQRSSFFPSERAPYRITSGIPCGRWPFASASSVAGVAKPALPLIGHTQTHPQTLPQGDTTSYDLGGEPKNVDAHSGMAEQGWRGTREGCRVRTRQGWGERREKRNTQSARGKSGTSQLPAVLGPNKGSKVKTAQGLPGVEPGQEASEPALCFLVLKNTGAPWAGPLRRRGSALLSRRSRRGCGPGA